MKKYERPTQEDVARLAGITRVTVNRAMMNHPAVSAATKARVREIAERIGYRPHVGARAIREGRYGCITLAVTSAFHVTYLPGSMLRGVFRGAQEHGYKLSLNILQYPAGEGGRDDGQIEEVLSAFATDGLVIDHSSPAPPPLYPLVQRHHIPAIWLNHRDTYDCVAPDDAQGAAWAARVLVEHGHRRVAFLQPVHDTHHSVMQRWLGYSEAMEAAGYAAQRVELPADAEEARRRLMGLLRRRGGPTGFVAYERREAEELLLALATCGLRVGEDVSVVVISDRDVNCGGVALTTCVIPFDRAGRISVDLLAQKIVDPRKTFPLTLVKYEYMTGMSSVRRRERRLKAD